MSSLSKSNSDSRVYVGNLPQNVRQRDLEDHFDKYGKVRGIDIHSRFDPAFAFIEFEDSRYIQVLEYFFNILISNFKSNRFFITKTVLILLSIICFSIF